MDRVYMMDARFHIHFDHEQVSIPDDLDTWAKRIQRESSTPLLELNTLNCATPEACVLSLTDFGLDHDNAVSVHLEITQLKQLRSALDTIISDMEQRVLYPDRIICLVVRKESLYQSLEK